MAFPWAAVAQAASQIGSSLIQGGQSKRAQGRANRWNIAQWNRQNEYNSPTAQMERLREAGLNPNLIYGESTSGATGHADRIAPAKAAETFGIGKPDFTQFSKITKTKAETNNLRSLNTVIVQDKMLKQQMTKGQEISNKFAPFLLGTSLQAQQAEVQNTYAKTLGVKVDNLVKNGTKAALIQEAGFRVLNAQATLKGTELKNALLEFEKELNLGGLTKTDSAIIRSLYINYDKLKKFNKKTYEDPKVNIPWRSNNEKPN